MPARRPAPRITPRSGHAAGRPAPPRPAIRPNGGRGAQAAGAYAAWVAGRPRPGFSAGVGHAAPSGAAAAPPGADPAADAGVDTNPVVTQPLPVDPRYLADLNNAQHDFNRTRQETQFQRGQLGQAYGFGVDINRNVFDDHTNPFSRAAALQQAHDSARAGTNTSYAARGQLYSGALSNAQTDNSRRNLQGRDSLIRQFMDARHGLDNRDTAAGDRLLSAKSAADSAGLYRALENA